MEEKHPDQDASSGSSPGPVVHVEVGVEEPVWRLIDGLADTGFNAKRLAKAAKIYGEMMEDKSCVKIMTLAGAMVPAGMRSVLSSFVQCGYVDILITTGATLTHDLIESLGHHHLQGTEIADDKELVAEQTNRIFDVFMPNSAYECMEDFVKELDFDLAMPLAAFLDFLGGEIAKLGTPAARKSLLLACHERGVPIYCPAFTDCGLGIQLLLNHPGLKLDIFSDLNDLINRAWDLDSVGVFIIGGGVPKNFAFQALQFSPNNAIHAIQVTMDRPEPGGLSGASLSEAISWGKVNPEAAHVTVVADATIILPLILAWLKHYHPPGAKDT